MKLNVDEIKGPWFSLGFHIDFQHRYVDLHILWWIITIGNGLYGCSDQDIKEWIEQETTGTLVEITCPNCLHVICELEMGDKQENTNRMMIMYENLKDSVK